MAEDRDYVIKAKTLGKLDAELAKRRAKERRVVAAARKRLGKKD